MSAFKIKTSATDRMLDILGTAGILLLIILPVIYTGKLPGTIPVHFDILGNPDRYGDKNTIWVLPAVGSFLFIIIMLIPRLILHSNKINPDGNEKTKTLLQAMRMLRLINVLVVFMFCSITYYTVLVSLGEDTGLWNLSTIFFLVLISIVIVVYVVKIMRATKPT